MLYECDNGYWLGNYSHPSPGNHSFVPATRRQVFDMPGNSGVGTNAGKGFWDDRTGRYLFWLWIRESYDRDFNTGWDSMMSVPRVMDVDPDLRQMTQYPADELLLLRRAQVVGEVNMTIAAGADVPLPAVASNTLDIELTFRFPTTVGALPAGTAVGCSVLDGAAEHSRVYIETAAPASPPAPASLTADLRNSTTYRFPVAGPFTERTDLPGGDYSVTHVTYTYPHTCEAACKLDPRCAAWTYVVRAEPKGSADCIFKSEHHSAPAPCDICTSGCVKSCDINKWLNPLHSVPLTLKPQEMSLRLRLLVDRSALEAFAQLGRAQMAARVYPNEADSIGMRVFHTGGTGAPAVVDISVWEMGAAML